MLEEILYDRDIEHGGYMSEGNESIPLTKEQQATLGLEQVIENLGDRELGEEAAKGGVSDGVLEAAKAAEQVNPDAFYAGAENAHWSNPDGPTGGMPPGVSVEKNTTTE